MPKNVIFRGRSVPIDEARNMLRELYDALAKEAPVVTDTPAGQTIATLMDPKWWVEPSTEPPGALLCLRDPALGWRGYLLPWFEAGNLAGLLVSQMATVLPAPSSELPGSTPH